VESKYYPNAVSKKGARGLMQIMPRTGEWVAQQLDLEGFHPDYLFDPEINIKIGTWYLSYLMKQFNGDLTLVLAAYNGGQGNVRDWLQQRNSNKENDLEDFPFRETRQYVIKINRVYRVYKRLYG
jgi:soluble lytic murein transglycosylase